MTAATRLRASGAVGFGLLPLLSAVTPLLVLPVVARTATMSEWAAVAVGQSIGAVAALALGGGYGLLGPALAARGEPASVLRESVRVRTAGAAVVLPLAVTVAWLAPTTPHHLLTAVSAASSALAGYSIAWLAVGTGRPAVLLWGEIAPRAAAAVVAAVAVAATGEVLAYPLCVLVAHLATTYCLLTRAGTPPASRETSGPVTLLRRHAPVTAKELVDGCYSVGAAALAGLTAGAAAVGEFSAGYRTTTYLAVGIVATSSTLQGWVLAADESSYRARVRRAAGAHLAVGLIGGLGLAVAGDTVTRILFGADLRASTGLLVPLGCFFALWSLETLTSRYLLAPHGALRPLVASSVCGLAVAVAVMPALAERHGAGGIAWAMTLGMLATLAWQLPAALRAATAPPSTDSRG